VSKGQDHIKPLERIARHTERVSLVCDVLEAIADTLPNSGPDECKEAARMCSAEIPRHYEELVTVLIPLIRKRIKGDEDCEAILDRLEMDIAEDTARLFELVDMLASQADPHARSLDTETLGYALRGFFETIRRQVCWENDVLIPMAGRRLETSDLDKMGELLLLREKAIWFSGESGRLSPGTGPH